jgi:glucose dehydrogenase
MARHLTGRPRGRPIFFTLLPLVLALSAVTASAQRPGSPAGEWRYQSGDAYGTRYSPLTQVNAQNFANLEVAWIFRGDNFGDHISIQSRSTPSYINGTLYTVAGYRRTVVAMDPASGEILWTFREPNTIRHERSMRANYGKGVAYGEVNGRGVIYVTTPAFFLWALDAKTGEPLENWGKPVPLPDFPQTGVIDLLPDLIADWGPWQAWREPYDPDYGIPRELGYITSSSPPIVVNGVVVVGNSAEQGYNQTRVENVPGDILGYDATTGEYMWKFHVIPRPGEFGHDTWENDAWQWTGDISSWAPMSADNERGIVYIPTNPPTIDYFGGFRPGDNLFGTTVIALNARTGERVWHFQTVHNDQWNYDLSNVPILADLNVPGRGQIPALIQTGKIGFIYAFNRVTGEPIWPIEERPVVQTQVPGNWTSPTQPFPTRPEPMEPIAADGLTDEHLIDFTPELRAEAKQLMSGFLVGNAFVPRLNSGHNLPQQNNIRCSGGINITNPATFDPETNILYVSHGPGCGGGAISPGLEADVPDAMSTTGTTISQWVNGAGLPGLPQVQGLPLWKPPYNRLSAYDMDTGERLWWIPIGEPNDDIKNHPLLRGVDTSRLGGGGSSIQMVTGSLLLTTGFGPSVLRAHDKTTGAVIGDVEIPAEGQYGMMSYMHEGKQYIVVQIGTAEYPNSLVTLTLPD